ncbi:DNA repair protein RecN [Tepidiforma thermophila]|uniref:DNA repair protein RecN n=1 Tax=Tepidiforma thermophila (strain KCTC 52669 / CGMCC 1.13589 / G233) TaxID=2761530 RepID=A0A2A9HH37_TEPT2|nr:DNA repair protein RecN [Tepidiforma thermophila]PFG74276.1 DNA repair protein RecN (Recombination protein N) [Tepidiforma thermophila]
MLEQLEITSFAVARNVAIDLGPGLTVFTGETGAGKSLVVDAIAFAFGARMGREVIAAGADRATVRAALRLGWPTVIERTLTLGGRSTYRIDGQPARYEDVRALAEGFLDIHGQSEQLAILRPAVQLAALDEFAGLQADRTALASTVRELREVRRKLASLRSDARERERLIERLSFEVAEIDAAAPVPGEDESLRAEQARLGNAARLREGAERALAALDEPAIGEVLSAVRVIAGRDPGAADLADLAGILETASMDLRRALRAYRDALDEDPERLAAVTERLDLLARLQRKYGDTIAAVLAYRDTAARQLADLTGAGASLEELEAAESRLLETLGRQAADLSIRRRAAAGALVGAIAAELDLLGMTGARLAVAFTCDDDPAGPLVALPDYEVVAGAADEAAAPSPEPAPRAFTEAGVDRVEFLASFNPGEPPRPLGTVASGGETSRFLLALTVALGQATEGRLEVLDEVDEGVGGRTGAVVGRALRRLAARHQVLCITHLPQVAAAADRHFVVEKRTDGRHTWSEVREVAGEARRAELAAMLGGVTPANLAAADELLGSAAAS